MLAFVEVAIGAFVGAIRAIELSIADAGNVDASFGDFRALPLVVRAPEGRFLAGVVRAFVAVVATVVFSIANVRLLTTEEEFAFLYKHSQIWLYMYLEDAA